MNTFHLIRKIDEKSAKGVWHIPVNVFVCSGTVYREQAGPSAQLLLPVPKERLLPLHPVLPPGPGPDIWLPQPHGPKRPLPLRQHAQHLPVWQRQPGMTVSWAVLGLFEHRHKPFTVRLPTAKSSLEVAQPQCLSLHFISYLSGIIFLPLHL